MYRSTVLYIEYIIYTRFFVNNAKNQAQIGKTKQRFWEQSKKSAKNRLFLAKFEKIYARINKDEAENEEKCYNNAEAEVESERRL